MSMLFTVNRHEFVLDDAVTVARVRSKILDAVRSGGEFVTFGASPDSPQMLITPATSVRITTLDAAPDRSVAGDEDIAFIDF